MRLRLLSVAILMVGWGLLAGSVTYVSREPGRTLIDLLAGWSLAGCGAIIWTRHPGRVGPLLVAAGASWFLRDLAFAPEPVVAAAARATDHLWVAFLAHALLTYPGGEADSDLLRWSVVVGYGLALVAPWWTTLGSAVFALGLVTVLLIDRRGRSPRVRRLRQPALIVAIVIAFLDGVAFALTLIPMGGRLDIERPTELAVALGALLLLLGRERVWADRSSVTDLVVELGERRGDDLDAALGAALGDPTVRVGYWSTETSRYVDAAGRPFNADTANGLRAATRVDAGGRPIAIVLSDPASADEPELVDAVVVAARTIEANARLRADVETRMGDVRGSRRRLLDVGVDERRALEARLRTRTLPLHDQLGTALEGLQVGAGSGPLTDREAHLQQAAEQLLRSREDLERVARGLHPGELDERGLEGSLVQLGRGSSVPVAVHVTGVDVLEAHLAATVWFVCSEALANVAKHARATNVSVLVEGSWDRLAVTIADDGVGGADPAGSGLRGLRDRVEALGGTLVVDSPIGRGTRLAAVIPTSDEARTRS